MCLVRGRSNRSRHDRRHRQRMCGSNGQDVGGGGGDVFAADLMCAAELILRVGFDVRLVLRRVFVHHFEPLVLLDVALSLGPADCPLVRSETRW